MAFHEMNINCYVSAIHSEFIFINRNLKIVVSLYVILGYYYFSWIQILAYLKPSLTIFFNNFFYIKCYLYVYYYILFVVITILIH